MCPLATAEVSPEVPQLGITAVHWVENCKEIKIRKFDLIYKKK